MKTQIKIEEGDWVYDSVGRQIFQNTPDKVNDVKHYIEFQNTLFKILALPEHFSPKHLQAIVDGKIKDGDKVSVECEEVCAVKRGSCDCSEQDIDCQCTHKIIKYNSSNHITLRKVEERAYTLRQLEQAFDAGYERGLYIGSGTEVRGYFASEPINKDEWFKQIIVTSITN